MKREDKVISLELAKQIDVEHKRLGIEVESEWWWSCRWNANYKLTDTHDGSIHAHQYIPAYDIAELLLAIVTIEHDRIEKTVNPIEQINPQELGEYYLYLLQNGHIKEKKNTKGGDMDKCRMCGEIFEHYDIDKDEWIDGKKQIVIGGNFTVDKDYGQITKVRLYACPECNSVFLAT